MQDALSLSPTGHLYISPTAEAQYPQIAKAFSLSVADGLVHLAAEQSIQAWSSSLLFWRDFSVRYFTQLCYIHSETTTALEILPPPTVAECDQLILRLPPMPGAEYCSQQTFVTLWSELDVWVRSTLSSLGSMGALLSHYLPHWSQVGRVCFHLAENKNDQTHPFAFMATYASHLSHSHRLQYQPLNKALQEFSGIQNKKALLKLLAPIYEASTYCDWVKDLMESRDIYYPLAWTPKEAYQLLQSVPELEKSGLLVRLPNWWQKKPRPRVQVTIGNAKPSSFGTDALLDFKLDVVLEGARLSIDELNDLQNAGTGLISLRGQWIEIDPEKLQKALTHWQSVQAAVAQGGLTFAAGMRLLAGTNTDFSRHDDGEEGEQSWFYVNAGEELRKILHGLRSPNSLAFQPPKDLKASLRPYQQTGVNWLYFLNELGLGACLADDMGLGKTIQVIALLLLKKQKQEAKTSLLVLPASLLGNWKAELARFAPSLNVLFLHTTELLRSEINKIALDRNCGLNNRDIVVTTYATLLRQQWLQDIDWDVIILDEAQAIKNPAAQQTKTIKTLKSRARIALTGTPVENRLGDLWSLFDFLSPGLLGGVTRFKSFVKSLENGEQTTYAPLRKLVQPYILRRLKTDKSIISDLPDKVEMTSWCGLSKMQAKLYAQTVRELQHALEQTLEKAGSGIKRRGLVLAFLTRFKQICNHPSQILGDNDYKPIDSGKFDRLRELCEEIASRQEKVLIFTQYREMTEPLAEFLATVFKRIGLVLHGSTSIKQRKKIVDQFQLESGPPFFVLSLKAAGTGLNLTAANHVIHFDRWWNPAVENQATDRAFRIGQKRNVLVHKFVCRGTVEEKVDQMIAEKSALVSDVLSGGGEVLLTEMNDKELLNLVSLDIEKAIF